MPWGGPHEAWQFWLSTGRFLLFWVQSHLPVAKRCRKCSCFVPRSRNYSQKGSDNRGPTCRCAKEGARRVSMATLGGQGGRGGPVTQQNGPISPSFRPSSNPTTGENAVLPPGTFAQPPSRPVAQPSRPAAQPPSRPGPAAQQKGPCSHKDFAWQPSESCLSWHYDALDALVFHSISDSWARVSTRAWVPF